MNTDQRKNILLVEDEALVAMAEKATLEKHGYAVTVCYTGEKAIETFRSSTAIDLILMDIELGSGMDGTEAAGAILREYTVPIVFLSSHTEPEIVEKTEQITSYGYVVKNSGETILLSAVKMALRLFDAKSRYRDIFAHSINGICVHRMLYDESGRPCDCEFMEINGTYTDHTGLTPGTVIGHTIQEIYPDEDTTAIIALYAQVLHTGIPQRTETYFAPTGKWFDLSVYPTGSNEFTVVVQDVSELKRQKEKYQRIFDLTPALISIAGSDGNFRELNAAWERTLGYSIEELKRRPFTDFMHPDDMAPTQREIQNQLEGCATTNFVNRYRHKDGSYRYLEWEATPAEGNVLYAVAKDVTERRTTEEELRATLEKYRKLTEGAHAILWEYDILRDHWSYVAPQVEEILGYAPQEWTGLQFWTDHIHEVDRHWARDYCMECTARGEAHTFEYRFLAKNGSVVWLRDVVNVEMAEGHPVRLRGLMIDITERKLAEEQVEQLLAEKETVMKEVQHRVKNTMNTMGSILTLQTNKLRNCNPDAAATLNDAKSRFQSMEVLYDQLYRTDTHNGGSLSEYLTRLVRSALSLFPVGETITLTTDIDDVQLDAKRLSTVGIIVNELVTNALKHAFGSGSDGELDVSVWREHGLIKINVADNGPGFPNSLPNAPESGFGMTMIEELARQLEGTLHFAKHGGLRAVVEFPQPPRDCRT